VNPAVIGEGSHGVERHREGEPGIVYARIKYSVRSAWGAGGRAMIVAGPSPIDDIASPDGHRARAVDGPALPHGNICRGRGSEHWQEDQKYERQSEIHFEGLVAARIWAGG
jgi:hypothetical protein